MQASARMDENDWQDASCGGEAEGRNPEAAARSAEDERHSVLLVDDEPLILDSLSRLLARQYEVTKAFSGEDGLKRLGERKIDLVISDNRMRGMRGCEFLARVREAYPDTLRFLMTGYPDLEIMNAIKRGVVTKYLQKPWVNQDFKKAIKDALDLRALKARDKAERLEAKVQMVKVLVKVDEIRKGFE